MPFSPSSFAVIEDTINRLAGECILAQPGKDDGLIPSYSLLTELAEAVATEPELCRPIAQAQQVLDSLLETARPFDEASLATLRQLAEWLPAALTALQKGAAVPALGEAQNIHSPVSIPTKCGALLDFKLEENQELWSEFHAEALDHLHQIESSLLTLDAQPRDRDALDQLFRSFHTLKGVSGFLHLTPMHTLTHEVESLLDLARNGKLTLTPSIITAILDSRDAVQTMVGQITEALERGTLSNEVVSVDSLIVRVKEFMGSSQPQARSERPATADRPFPVTDEATSNVVPFASMSFAGSSSPLAAAASAVRPGERKTADGSGTLRVSTNKLDAIMDSVGELVIAHSQIAESAGRLADGNSPLSRNIAQLGRITKELQNNAMSLRLVPIKSTFQKMERLVRDLARHCGKTCHFQTVGEDTELDRTVVEDIADPLVHMIRNSLDHGLEKPGVRVAAGKPECGKVVLKAFHQGSHVHIELSDDGQGIDPERVYAKAVGKGVIANGASLTRDEVLNLIFHPGFSTADEVTAVSGRGVGMDVVRRNIERLRGKIEIETEVGKGTTFRIKLPLTMAIIDGLVVRVGADRFILPSTQVQMALRPAAEAISAVPGRGEMLDHRGRVLPIERLNRKFRIPGAIENPAEGILLLVETSDKVTALLVDEMVSKQEVVIKTLGGFLTDLPGIAGGAILGDGNIALILDPTSLFAAA